tara:strand:- start:1900 stop:2538 length:639 start_codon:yes stop_codon:yes gene_type:complete
MKTIKYSTPKINKNPEAFFMATTSAFAQNGFRRTTMNDIAEATDMSRPALYLTFKNKEDLFSSTVSYLVTEAVKESLKTLSQEGSIENRFLNAMLDFEQIYWGPIAKSRYALELINSVDKLDNASEAIKLGRDKLRTAFSKALQKAVRNGEVTFVGLGIQPAAFVGTLMSILAAKKYRDTANPDYTDMPHQKIRRRNSKIIKIFLQSIIVRP